MRATGMPRPCAVVPVGAGARAWVPLLLMAALTAVALGLPERARSAVRSAFADRPVELSVEGVRILPAATIVVAPDVSGSMFGSKLFDEMVAWARPQLRYLSTEPAFAAPDGRDDVVLLPWSDAPVVQAGPTDWAGVAGALGTRSPVDGGHTWLVPVLTEVERLVPAGRPGVVLVFTDGQVGDADLVAPAVRRLADRGIAVHLVGMGGHPGAWQRLPSAWGDAPLASVTPNTATSLGRLVAEAVGLRWTGS